MKNKSLMFCQCIASQFNKGNIPNSFNKKSEKKKQVSILAKVFILLPSLVLSRVIWQSQNTIKAKVWSLLKTIIAGTSNYIHKHYLLTLRRFLLRLKKVDLIYFTFLFIFIFHFSIFRTTRVRVDWSCYHISHLMA